MISPPRSLSGGSSTAGATTTPYTSAYGFFTNPSTGEHPIAATSSSFYQQPAISAAASPSTSLLYKNPSLYHHQQQQQQSPAVAAVFPPTPSMMQQTSFTASHIDNNNNSNYNNHSQSFAQHPSGYHQGHSNNNVSSGSFVHGTTPGVDRSRSAMPSDVQESLDFIAKFCRGEPLLNDQQHDTSILSHQQQPFPSSSSSPYYTATTPAPSFAPQYQQHQQQQQQQQSQQQYQYSSSNLANTSSASLANADSILNSMIASPPPPPRLANAGGTTATTNTNLPPLAPSATFNNSNSATTMPQGQTLPLREQQTHTRMMTTVPSPSGTSTTSRAASGGLQEPEEDQEPPFSFLNQSAPAEPLQVPHSVARSHSGQTPTRTNSANPRGPDLAQPTPPGPSAEKTANGDGNFTLSTSRREDHPRNLEHIATYLKNFYGREADEQAQQIWTMDGDDIDGLTSCFCVDLKRLLKSHNSSTSASAATAAKTTLPATIATSMSPHQPRSADQRQNTNTSSSHTDNKNKNSDLLNLQHGQVAVVQVLVDGGDAKQQQQQQQQQQQSPARQQQQQSGPTIQRLTPPPAQKQQNRPPPAVQHHYNRTPTVTLKAAMTQMRRGTNMCKYSRNGTPQMRFFNIQDRRIMLHGELMVMPHLCWGADDTVAPSGQLCLIHLIDLRFGAESPNFKKNRYGQLVGIGGAIVNPQLCFSLVFTSRTMDICVCSPEDWNLWVDGMKLVLERNKKIAAST